MGEAVTWLLLLALCTNPQAQHTLAPHPLIFTIDGRPTKLNFETNGMRFRMSWDGEEFIIRERGSALNDYVRKYAIHLPETTQTDQRVDDTGKAGCILIFFIYFYIGMIAAIIAYFLISEIFF